MGWTDATRSCLSNAFLYVPHQKLFFRLNETNCKKAKMKGELSRITNHYRNDLARFLMGNFAPPKDEVLE